MKKKVIAAAVGLMVFAGVGNAFAADASNSTSNGDINIGGNNNGTIHNNITNNITKVNIQLDDINGHWAEKYIKDLVAKGILKGDDNHHFNPNQHATREQFASMVARTFDLKNTSTSQDFMDVPQKRWSFNAVEATKDYFDAFKDLNGGYDFHPTEGAQRQDVTVTLVKVLMKVNPSIQLMDAGAADQLLQTKFKDADSITGALRPYVATAVQNNLIHGDDEGRFNPDKTLTRAEAATLLDRLSDLNVVVGISSSSGTTAVTGSTYGTTSN